MPGTQSKQGSIETWLVGTKDYTTSKPHICIVTNSSNSRKLIMNESIQCE